MIIDELHAFFDNKRGDLLSLNLERLATLAPQARRIGLSATIDKPDAARDWLCRDGGAMVRVPQAVAPVIDILQTDNRIRGRAIWHDTRWTRSTPRSPHRA